MKISEYLQSLGNSSEEVAENMRLQGIKGIRCCKRRCVILNAIYKAMPDLCPGLTIVNGRQSEDKSHWYYCLTWDDAQTIDPILPQAVSNFAGDFDTGKYPDLVAKRVVEVKTRLWE